MKFQINVSYGPLAERLLQGVAADDRRLEALIGHFYEALLEIPQARAVLANLTESEFTRLQGAQLGYFKRLLAPDLEADAHRVMAEEAGRRHFDVGLPIEVLADGHVLYDEMIHSLVGLSSAAARVLVRRTQIDLATQIGAYASVHRERERRFKLIEQSLAESEHALDFLQTALDGLTGSLSGSIIGLALGSQGNSGYRHQFAAGRVPWLAVPERSWDFPTVQLTEMGKVWADEEPLILNSLHRDDALSSPAALEACRSLGIRSLGVFPARDARKIPQHLLMVASRYPGYFQGQDTVRHWQDIAAFLSSMLQNLLERKRPANRIADGLRFRRSLMQEDVCMHYQPIVDVGGRVVKLEALARLEIDGEVISPGRFLPAFGSRQLMDLFDVGLQCVINDMTALGPIAPLCSINLPTEGLLDATWMSALPARLERLGATPDRLAFEIVESAIADHGDARKRLDDLHKAGYSILLDDVGAGESSLLRLAELPVSGIKIDQAFVRPLQHNMERLDLVFSMLWLAEQRGMERVVEGVETLGIVDIVASIGDPLIQGYAIARPMPANQLADFLAHGVRNMPQNFPCTLQGWYARHVSRMITVHAALSTIPDFLDIATLRDGERCPLHAPIMQLGGDEDIVRAHLDWHERYAYYMDMVRHGASSHSLWAEMEAGKLSLRMLIQKKLGLNAGILPT